MVKKDKLIKNIIWGFGGQTIIILLGLIIPRIMLVSYGSDTNGLIGTITQVFTYMALLEAGIGTAAKNALYKPLNDRDETTFSAIVSAAQKYFRKVTILYFALVLIFSILGPIVLRTSLSRVDVFLLILFEGISGVLNFFFIQTKTIVLAADGRGYINNAVNVVYRFFVYVVRIVLALLGVSVLVLQFCYIGFVMLKIVYYKWYFRKHYSWISLSTTPRMDALRDRNSYVITEIAWTIFSSTDMIVLSVMLSTQMASVYSVYNMIFVQLNTLLATVYHNVVYILGKTYHRSIQEYIKLHDAFDSIFIGIMTTMMSVSYVLIIPFIRLYTTGVNDISYVDTSIPVMFCLVQLLSWSRYTSGQLSGIAGYAKQTSYISLIEAILNVVMSIIFVKMMGIRGVLLATVLSLPVKVVYLLVLANKTILKRSCKKTILIYAANIITFVLSIIVTKFVNINPTNYGELLFQGILLSFIFGFISILLNITANKEMINVFLDVLKGRRRLEKSI